MADIPLVVKQNEDADLLNLFITALEPNDTTAGMFSQHYSQTTTPSPMPDKVNRVCSAIREYLLTHNDTIGKKLFTVVLTCFLMERPSRVSDALSCMKSQVDKGFNASLRKLSSHCSVGIDPLA